MISITSLIFASCDCCTTCKPKKQYPSFSSNSLLHNSNDTSPSNTHTQSYCFNFQANHSSMHFTTAYACCFICPWNWLQLSLIKACNQIFSHLTLLIGHNWKITTIRNFCCMHNHKETTVILSILLLNWTQFIMMSKLRLACHHPESERFEFLCPWWAVQTIYYPSHKLYKVWHIWLLL